MDDVLLEPGHGCCTTSSRAGATRRWWVEQWPAGAAYITCLVAQDVQEVLLEPMGRWPVCTVVHEDEEDTDPGHELRVAPDLGEDPHWVCEAAGVVVGPVGGLPSD